MNIVDYKSESASLEFATSLRETGFAVLKNFPIDLKLIESCYEAWGSFFNEKEEYKNKFEFTSKTHNGFVSRDLSETAKGMKKKDLKEFYHYYISDKCPENIRPVTDELFKQMLVCATELLNWVQHHCPAEVQEKFSMPLSDMIQNSPRNLLRFINYPPLDGSEDVDAIRAAAHGDINLLTVLPSGSEPGLQVLKKDGQWMDVPYNKDYLVVNIGDMLEECSGGYYKSTMHRVVNPEGADMTKARMSMPMFLHPRDDVRLSDRYLASEYCQERFKELGLSDVNK
jgi:isopenicillin N synthase-like dioxygenase